MNDPSKMSDQTISEVIANAIFLPVLESGATPCGAPDGLTIAKSGPDLVRAKVSRSRGRPTTRKRRYPTRGYVAFVRKGGFYD